MIFGIYRVKDIPNMGTREMYNTNSILRLKSIFQLRLFKFLRALLDGTITELYGLLLRPGLKEYWELGLLTDPPEFKVSCAGSDVREFIISPVYVYPWLYYY